MVVYFQEFWSEFCLHSMTSKTLHSVYKNISFKNIPHDICRKSTYHLNTLHQIKRSESHSVTFSHVNIVSMIALSI